MAPVKGKPFSRWKYKYVIPFLNAVKKHAEGHIAKHKANVNILIKKNVGVAEHPDIIETIEKELDIIA
ncbi:MAG: hypothetical protein VW171_01540, partial [Alphaproteobacteria bacterium]